MLNLGDLELSMSVIRMHKLLSFVDVEHIGDGSHVLVFERWLFSLGVTSSLVELAIN